MLVPQTLENPMRRVPLLARHVRIRVRLQDRVDDAGEPVQLRNVEPGSTVSTDELMSYGLLNADGYKHGQVRHGAKEFARYDRSTDVVHHTNHVESFWRLFKYSVASTHIHVSAKYMGRYLDEVTFRQNHRVKENAMFDPCLSGLHPHPLGLEWAQTGPRPPAKTPF